MKKPSVLLLLKKLELVQRQFDSESVRLCASLLKALSEMKHGDAKTVRRYADALLFSVAYPANTTIHRLAEKELKRLSLYVEVCSRKNKKNDYYNSGISGSEICAEFSLTHNKWLLHKYGKAVELYTEEHNEVFLVNTLNHLLHPVEQELMHAGRTDWNYWSSQLTGSKGDQHHLLHYIVRETDKLSVSRAMREFIFAEYKTYTSWKSRANAPSMYAGRAVNAPFYLHSDGILKRIHLQEALAQGEPQKVNLRAEDQQQLIDLGKGTLCALLRETDPISYANLKEVELFDMGRGVAVALYYMTADMKMTLQSYVGYMLFKNRVPCAYGGGWLLNDESGFGINIFPPFRGGESANVLCQLLRLYAWHFKVNTFTIDPYQIGLDNPDGIQSGSFWFYYRLGFRPEQKNLFELAAREFKKITRKKGYKSSEKTLLELAHSSMRWTHPLRESKKTLVPEKIGLFLQDYITKKHGGNRNSAQDFAMRCLEEKCAVTFPADHPIKGIALLMCASRYTDRSTGEELKAFIATYSLKGESEAAYIRQVQAFPAFFDSLYRAANKTA